MIEDDESDPARVRQCIRRLASSCDVLLGPYSGTLMRAAAAALSDSGILLWNHGGAADDVQRRPGAGIVSVLTPASRYSQPLLRHLSGLANVERLLIVHGRGGFAQQVSAGAGSAARREGMQVEYLLAGPPWTQPTVASRRADHLVLLCAGSFEEDLQSVSWVRSWSRQPVVVCAVAAGVREFGGRFRDPIGVLGIAQWIAGGRSRPQVGPAEEQFIEAYRSLTGSAPDYPAAQAAAAAALAIHCIEAAGSTDSKAVWKAAVDTRTRTFFGEFAVDKESGEQTTHSTVLTVWAREGLSRAK
jgi:ABC-type branched-subunit amino acid transport system substrate-binding protein